MVHLDRVKLRPPIATVTPYVTYTSPLTLVNYL